MDDRTRALLVEMNLLTNEYNERGLFYSGAHASALTGAKSDAFHEFRDEEGRARLDLSRLRAREQTWHWLWRKVRKRAAPRLTAREDVEPFLERWREPVTRHSSSPADTVPVLDRTRRTRADALAELPSLALT